MRSATSSGCSTKTVEWLITPGDERFARRQFGALPHRPFVLVTRIRGLEGIGAGADFQDEVHDVLELQIMHARPHVDAVAGVMPNFFRRKIGRASCRERV